MNLSSLPLHLVELLPIRPPVRQLVRTPIHPTEGLDIASTHGYGTMETCPFLTAVNVCGNANTARPTGQEFTTAHQRLTSRSI